MQQRSDIFLRYWSGFACPDRPWGPPGILYTLDFFKICAPCN